MKKLYIVTAVLITLLCSSCKQESLQGYIVESQDKKGFSHISIPTDIFQFVTNAVSEEEKAAYASIRKINVTGLLSENASDEAVTIEKEKLKSIFKNSDYKKLIEFKKDGMKATIYYTGETDAIDEIIAFGYGNEVGVGVARILGDNMNPNAVINMLKNTKLDTDNINLSQFKMIFDKVK